MFCAEAEFDAEAQPERAEELEEQLAEIADLTPGDFATVKRQANMLDEQLSPDAWLEQLAAEAKAKMFGLRRQQVGFDGSVAGLDRSARYQRFHSALGAALRASPTVRRLLILGSTGSIGTQALDVLRRSDDLELIGLSAERSWEALIEQARAHEVSGSRSSTRTPRRAPRRRGPMGRC